MLGLTLLALCQVTPTDASAHRETQPDPPALFRESEDAAERGLAWLAEQQSERGYWQADVGHKRMDGYVLLRSAEFNERIHEGHIGVSAIAGIAFLAGGHLPNRGTYGKNVQRCLDYVCAHTEDSGMITDGGTRMYSHAFATLFLAEIYGMSGDEKTRLQLERAVHLIVDCQNVQGGWRYNAFTPEADVSVTVCQVQALRAARNIGVEVPKSTIDAAVAFIKRARTPHGHNQGLFYYKNEGRSARTKNTEYAINAAAATALFAAGVHEEKLFAPVLDFLEDGYGQVHDYYADHYYYWYGNYYACQAFFQAGGVRYERFQDRICRDLIRSQRGDGRWVNSTGPGDAFSTAVACIVLQIRRQFLPIFQR
ncbi:MAG: hypothetical protein KDB80_08435 [Planctomycetes bacterium]|nr:hypothetical protein [Planctomycetota bacterium]